MRRYTVELRTGATRDIVCDDVEVRRNALNFYIAQEDGETITIAVVPIDLVKWVDSEAAPGN